MIFRCKEYIRSQKIMVQVFIFTSSVIVLISSFQFLLINQLTSYISGVLEQQLLQQIIMKDFQNKIDNIMGEILQTGKLEFMQLVLEDYSRIELFNVPYKIQVNDIDVLQFCNSTTLNNYSYYQQQSQFQTYIELQKQFYPFTQPSIVQTYYTFTFDSDCLFIQTEGKQQEALKQNALNIKQIMMVRNIPTIMQSFFYEHQYVNELFLRISPNIIIGKSFKQEHSTYRQLMQKNKIMDLKFYYINVAGIIISNTFDDDFNGHYFQNPGISGFNQEQFYDILKYSLDYPGNNCAFKFKLKIYCLLNAQNKTQIIYSQFTSPTEIILMILDGQEIQLIQHTFLEELYSIVNQAILQSYLVMATLVIVCFVIQYLLIYLLNRPITQIQQIAQYQINNQQRILNILRIDKQQSQIQKLCDSFYNLIHVNEKLNRKRPNRCPQTTYNKYSNKGLIWNRQYKQQSIFETYQKINEIQQT